jgi:2-octaprenyl-6-methoxyphenol hydroxylase
LLPNGDGFALVWCVNPAAATGLAEADDRTFLSALNNCFGSRLGKFIDVRGRQRFPLTLRFMKNNPGARVVAIGNAAQSLHPVAGQGLNLGLRDAWELAQALLDPEISIAHPEFAKAFMRHRAADRRIEIGLTDLLARTFSRSAPPLGAMRGAALLTIDVLPPVKRFLGNFMLHGSRPNRMAATQTDAGAVREKIVTPG